MARAAARARSTAATPTGRTSINADVISMPDKWEYPWYAAWDLAFHCIPLALVDPDFAKEQLVLLLREWYMHPNGQMPAYEWAFGDVNPPVHAWAAWRVYKIDKKRKRRRRPRVPRARLPQAAAELHLVGESQGRRGQERLPGRLPRPRQHRRLRPQRAAARPAATSSSRTRTSWMGMYCLNMLTIALELARDDSAYEDVASKFFEHFVYICRAMNNIGGEGIELWDREDGFFYDVLHLPTGATIPHEGPLDGRPDSAVRGGDARLGARSTACPASSAACSGSSRTGRTSRSTWRPQSTPDGRRATRFFSLVSRRSPEVACCGYMLDESEFLSPLRHPRALALPPGASLRAST